MKNKLVFAALVLIMAFVDFGCSSTSSVTFDSIVPDSTPTIFEGIWINPSPGSQNMKFTFSGIFFHLKQGQEI
jgi:hypothetical protein